MVTGWLIYLPAVVLICGLAHRIYGMPLPENWFSLFALTTLGVFAFRSIGLILASIVNSTQESTIGIQLLYMPMLFLSGATFPTVMLPAWAQIVGQFLPATYLVTGFQSVFLRKETLAQNWQAAAALALTMVLATFISVQLFRWEKGRAAPAASSGYWRAFSIHRDGLLSGLQQGSQAQGRPALAGADAQRRSDPRRKDLRRVRQSDRVRRRARQERQDQEVYAGAGPDARQFKADVIEAAGKNAAAWADRRHVHLGSSGGSYDSPAACDPRTTCGASWLRTSIAASRR